MCYTYLQKWKETKSEKYIEKFKKHSITIDKGFANSDVSSEVSVLEIKLAAIVKVLDLILRSLKEKKKRDLRLKTIFNIVEHTSRSH